MIPGAPSVAAAGRKSGIYYPFTMTAGLFSPQPGYEIIGYQEGQFGTLSHQPIPDKTLVSLDTTIHPDFISSSFVFMGDEANFLSKTGLKINGVVHPFIGNSSQDFTSGFLSLPPDTFVENQEYEMAFVAAPRAGLPVVAQIMGKMEDDVIEIDVLTGSGYICPLPDLGSGMATLWAIVIEPDGSGYAQASGADPSSLVAVLTGSRVWIDNVEYPFDTDWYVDDGEVIAEWDAGNAPPLLPDIEYHFRLE